MFHRIFQSNRVTPLNIQSDTSIDSNEDETTNSNVQAIKTLDNLLLISGFAYLCDQDLRANKIIRIFNWPIIILEIFNLIRFTLYLFLNGNSFEKLIIGDHIWLATSLPGTNLMAIIIAVRIIANGILLNLNEKHHFNWIVIINFMRRKVTFEELSLSEAASVKMYSILKICINVTKIMTYLVFLLVGSGITIPITLIQISIFNEKHLSLFFFILIWKFLNLFTALISIANMMVTPMLFFFICYYCKLRASQLNEIIAKMIKKPIYMTGNRVLNMIKEHEAICNMIEKYNKFWSKVFYIAIVTSILQSLVIIKGISSLLKEELTVHTLIWTILYIIGLASVWVYVFFVTSCCASVTKEIHKSHKKLGKLQWMLEDKDLKIKVIYFNAFGLYDCFLTFLF